MWTAWVLGLGALSLAAPVPSGEDPGGLGRKAAGVLAEACLACHGPDASSRQADLRLDGAGLTELREARSTVLGLGGSPASLLLERVQSEDPGRRMPPPEAKIELSGDQLRVLEEWIGAGAPVSGHWSFAAPEENERLGVDGWIDRAAAEQGLLQSPLAAPEAWLRRASYVLTGLPPSAAELDTFLAGDGDLEAEVERLLASPSFGERMAVDWLDVARYADTYGYQSDVERAVWPWRDWVIGAFNEGLGYDDFVRWQLAGDLLPERTTEQRLATAFQRLHRQTNEGGSVEEEYRLEYVGDRTHTFGTAFLGLTLECARCHDHKFDPLSQEEYFSLTSFFANIDESGLYSHFTSATPTPAMTLGAEEPESTLSVSISGPGRAPMLEGWYPLDDIGEGGALENRVPDGPAGSAHGELRVEDGGLAFNGDRPATFPGVGVRRRFEPLSFGLWLWMPASMDRAVVLHRSKAWHDSGSRGYQLLIEEGRLSASWIHFWPGDALRVVTEEALPVGQWVHLAVAYDGSSRASGVKIWIDGRPAATEVVRDKLTRKIVNGAEKDLTLGERFRDRGFRGGRIRDLLVFDGAIGNAVVQALQVPEWDRLQAALAASGGSQESIDFEAMLLEGRRSRAEALDALPQIMVMEEMEEPRATHVLQRGSYLTPGKLVEPGVPAALPDWPEGAPTNRLGLAEWLLDPAHPLTARVAVNRLWQQVFGRGLVETSEDFGVQGSLPSHPELLDELALDFVESGWDVKGMLRRLVLSEAFRRSSKAAGGARELDPDNRWLARGPKARLSAEMLRDTALRLGGLLVDRIGGPPVRPYQPAGLWKEVSGREYHQAKGEGLYRRSLYTIWKRTAPPPSMELLDAAKRDVCVARRQTTSTPLQALVLWNDPQFVEAARGFAERILRMDGDDAARLLRAFREATSRAPESRELQTLTLLLEDMRQTFREDSSAAAALIAVGQREADARLDPAELAAWSCVLHTLLASDACVVLR